MAYIDPAKADQAREEGNVAFKAGDFAKSVTHYEEAIKRNPEDPKGYSNRCAALTKLMALPEALKDADKAIEVDPAFGESASRQESKHRLGQGTRPQLTRRNAPQSRATSDERASSLP